MGDIPFMTMSLLVAIFNIAPFCWQVEHRNSGPIALGFWTILLNAVNFVNAYVWRNDVVDRAPVLCDIIIKIQLIAPIGTVCGNVCVTRFLALIVSPSARNFTAKERKRLEIEDYIISFGIPIVLAALQIIYQPTRYGIVKTIGCGSTFVLTWPTYICYIVWFPLISMVGCFISVYVMYRLYLHQRDFRKLLRQSNSALTTSRFVRLTLLGVCSIIFNSIFAFLSATAAISSGSAFIDYSWDTIHSDFSTILTAPMVEKATFGNWGAIIAGIKVLLFFGFASEANSYYAKIANLFGLTKLLKAAERRVGPSDPPSASPVIEMHKVYLAGDLADEKHPSTTAVRQEADDGLPAFATPFQLVAETSPPQSRYMDIAVVREAQVV